MLCARARWLWNYNIHIRVGCTASLFIRFLRRWGKRREEKSILLEEWKSGQGAKAAAVGRQRVQTLRAKERGKREPSVACKAARIYIFISPFTTIFKYMRKKIEFEAAAVVRPALPWRFLSLSHTLRQSHTHCKINFLTTTTRGRNWHCSLFSAPPSQLFIFPTRARPGKTFLIREYAREIAFVSVRGEGGGGESELQGCKNGFFFVRPVNLKMQMRPQPRRL